MSDRQRHWENVWSTKQPTEVSWFQAEPTRSVELVRAACSNGSVIDIGGGSSLLATALFELGYDDITVLDIALAANINHRATRIVADITAWTPTRTYDVWHDRAAFHFLTSAFDAATYGRAMAATLAPGGHAIIGTFALDGPEQCSGLPVVRYDAATLAGCFAADFDLVSSDDDFHLTPWQSTQHFTFVTLRRR